MARYTDAVCRLCRREGEKLFLKGSRCLGPKCAFETKGYPPGEHGIRLMGRRRRQSDYSLQLREKQKARRTYGVFEKQFRRYFQVATRAQGLTGVELIRLLETRLDNVVFRLGFAESRAQARQLVTHGHFEVNGRRVNIPSYTISADDVITVRTRSKRNGFFSTPEWQPTTMTPSWLALDAENLQGQVLHVPSTEEMGIELNVQLIVEYYSAR